MSLLHIHGGEPSSEFSRFVFEVLIDALFDLLVLVPFLFLTYLLMEFIEHNAKGKVEGFMKKAGDCGSVFGAVLGAIPQCGFSAAASSLFCGRVISMGTLVAVFLSTSDEMIPILLSGSVPPLRVLFIVIYKIAVAALVGLLLDFVLRLMKKGKQEINIDAFCEVDGCGCERGVFHSALYHTLKITAFVFAVTLVLNTLIFFIGEERIAALVGAVPLLSHFVAALVGFIPNCAASVMLATLYSDGIISAGAMTAGLFSGAGVGMLVLLKQNKNMRENATVLLTLFVTGVVFGALLDLILFI